MNAETDEPAATGETRRTIVAHKVCDTAPNGSSVPTTKLVAGNFGETLRDWQNGTVDDA